MPKYFYDTEFLEDGQRIQLLSIGIVAEDGRELYMETQRAAFYKQHPEHCPNEWVRANVIPHLLGEGNGVVRSWAERKAAILEFMDVARYGKPELWGYYSAYDHVAFCQIFGKMIDLPKGFPMYTNDLKQLCVSLGDPQLPEQGEKEHHALADAHWNRAVYQFLRSYDPISTGH